MSLRDEIVAKIGEQVEDATFYADAIADALMPLVERAVKEAAVAGWDNCRHYVHDGTAKAADDIVARIMGGVR